MRVEGDLVIPVPGILQVAVFPSGRALEIEHFGLVIEDLQPGLAPVVFLESLSLDTLEADAQLVPAGFVNREPKRPVRDFRAWELVDEEGGHLPPVVEDIHLDLCGLDTRVLEGYLSADFISPEDPARRLQSLEHEVRGTLGLADPQGDDGNTKGAKRAGGLPGVSGGIVMSICYQDDSRQIFSPRPQGFLQEGSPQVRPSDVVEREAVRPFQGLDGLRQGMKGNIKAILEVFKPGR